MKLRLANSGFIYEISLANAIVKLHSQVQLYLCCITKQLGLITKKNWIQKNQNIKNLLTPKMVLDEKNID